tara:strand:+ start:39 stop:242 length:204 start_codon:yes stop_codon:yes gene_type:complete
MANSLNEIDFNHLSEDWLCKLAEEWCKENNLPFMSFDELLLEDSIKKTEEQKEFIKAYMVIWDYVMH